MDTHAATTLGQRLRATRLVRGLTQDALAERSGVDARVIRRLERGDALARRFTTIAALARVLDIAPSWLLSDDPDAPGGP
jgi:transcriptional regulator with XRE-family HTH domain